MTWRVAGCSPGHWMKISFPLGGCLCKACLTGFSQCGWGNFCLGNGRPMSRGKGWFWQIGAAADTSAFCPGHLKVSSWSSERWRVVKDLVSLREQLAQSSVSPLGEAFPSAYCYQMIKTLCIPFLGQLVCHTLPRPGLGDGVLGFSLA